MMLGMPWSMQRPYRELANLHYLIICHLMSCKRHPAMLWDYICSIELDG